MKNIVLIGMMGCGKSTIGALLAQKLGLTLVDTETPLHHDAGTRGQGHPRLGTQGAAILGNLGDDLGMVINPGAAFGFEIDPEGVANIRRDFKPTEEGEDENAAAGDAQP